MNTDRVLQFARVEALADLVRVLFDARAETEHGRVLVRARVHPLPGGTVIPLSLTGTGQPTPSVENTQRSTRGSRRSRPAFSFFSTTFGVITARYASTACRHGRVRVSVIQLVARSAGCPARSRAR